jgi:hypothetical protein
MAFHCLDHDYGGLEEFTQLCQSTVHNSNLTEIEKNELYNTIESTVSNTFTDEEKFNSLCSLMGTIKAKIKRSSMMGSISTVGKIAAPVLALSVGLKYLWKKYKNATKEEVKKSKELKDTENQLQQAILTNNKHEIEKASAKVENKAAEVEEAKNNVDVAKREVEEAKNNVDVAKRKVEEAEKDKASKKIYDWLITRRAPKGQQGSGSKKRRPSGIKKRRHQTKRKSAHRRK